MLNLGFLENNQIQAIIRDYEMRGWPLSEWHAVGRNLILHVHKTETTRFATVHKGSRANPSEDNKVMYAEAI